MIEIIAPWLPFIVIMAVWVFFSAGLRKRSAKGMELSAEAVGLMHRIADSNDRILAALEAKANDPRT